VAASSVVGADIGVFYNPFWAYYVPDRHRQCPARLAIRGGKVETTFYFQRLSTFGPPTQAERASDLPPRSTRLGNDQAFIRSRDGDLRAVEAERSPAYTTIARQWGYPEPGDYAT
jgi:hypothetical protein